ncbi:MAG: glutamate formimidoyltransferase [Anaerolineaceae bacterium]|nr:glutamate formimidoyltransferase [Anaerolineaceae bacterium]
MPNPLVECIPNFSEARRPEVVEAILKSISSVPEVTVLDHHSDLDHNRTVVTCIGSPDVVEEAVFQAIQTAARLIDLDHHTGQHPRLGATDVVPFVPIRDMNMQDCVEIARRLGKRVGNDLRIPVYLYEEAATRPDRRNLEDIRRGEYEGLKQEIGMRPERNPDFGPLSVGPAGGTIIGARQPLIAFNVYLTTDDVSIAQKIAKAVRNSSGGLHFVKALGLLVEGKAQVSMNMTNFRQTPLARAVEMVRREAERYGVGILSSELVGLVPQEAIVDAATWYLQLDRFEPEQILEYRLQEALADGEARSQSQPLEASLLDDLAKGTPTPGGGSAAAHAGATAAALVAMVARLTVGKKKYATVETRMWQIIEEADLLRRELTQAVEDDAAAFTHYLTAIRLPKDTLEQQAARNEAIQKGVDATIRTPIRVSEMSIQVLRLAIEAARTGNVNAISDAASGAALARASLRGASLNVRINCPNLTDQVSAQTYLAKIHQLSNEALNLEEELDQLLVERGNLPS